MIVTPARLKDIKDSLYDGIPTMDDINFIL